MIVNGKKIDLSLPLVHVKGKIEGIFTLDGEKIETLQGVKVALFCGIGNPSRFVKTVEALGADVQESLFALDHRAFKMSELSSLLARSGAKYLVCTEKDRVKIGKTSLPILWIKRSLLVDENEEAWQKALQEIGNRL